MNVDLSKARAGDTVKFRCGGQAVIGKVTNGARGSTVLFAGTDWSDFYNNDGCKFSQTLPHVMDITEVIPAPVAFDWSTVARGMCFKDGTGVRFWWVGKSYKEHDFYIEDADGGIWRQHGTQHLTRAPEHDVEAV